MSRQLSNVAQQAKLIRAQLKVTFPTVKFAVKSHSYSGGSSISIHWVDFPTEQAVSAIACEYESVSRDQFGDILSGGNRYVSCSNTWTDETRARIESAMPVQYERTDNDYYYWFNKAADSVWEQNEMEWLAAAKGDKIVTCANCGKRYPVDAKIELGAENDAWVCCKRCSDALDVKQVTETPLPKKEGAMVESVTVPTVSLNAEHNGIEIRFPSKPAAGVIAMLKETGFRWSGRGFWYAKHTPERVTLADSIAGTSDVYADTFHVAEALPPTNEVVASNPYAGGVSTIEQALGVDVVAQLQIADQFIAVDETSATPERIPAVSIRFDWSESSHITDNLTVSTFAEADHIVRHAAQFAPDTGAYDKTAFTITYADAETYTGRIDITRADSTKAEPLTEHVRNFVEYSAGVRKPSHMTQEDYDAYMSAMGEQSRQSFAEFHARYIIGDVAPKPTPDTTPKHSALIIDFSSKRAESWGAKLSNVDRLKLYTLTNLLGQSVVAEAVANGITVDQLFTVTANAAEIAQRITK